MEQTALEKFKEALRLLMLGKKAGKSSVSAATQRRLAAKQAIADWMAARASQMRQPQPEMDTGLTPEEQILLGQAYSADADSVLAAIKKMK